MPRYGLQLEATSAAGAFVLAACLGMIASALPSLDGWAQSRRQRPAMEQPEQYPDGPNREETFYFCAACHSFKIVAAQGMSRQRWNESFDWMVKRHNMPEVQGEDREKMLDYLATAFPERRQPGGWKNPFAPN